METKLISISRLTLAKGILSNKGNDKRRNLGAPRRKKDNGKGRNVGTCNRLSS
jgi:hypothetical protein